MRLYLYVASVRASSQKSSGRLAVWRAARVGFMRVRMILSAREFSWG